MATANNDIQTTLTEIKDKIRVTKVVVTRSVKCKGSGDFFIGFSAEWDTVQDDGGQGLISAGDSTTPDNAMSLKEALIASRMLAMQADVAANEQAMAGGGISARELKDRVNQARTRYGNLILRDLNGIKKDG